VLALFRSMPHSIPTISLSKEPVEGAIDAHYDEPYRKRSNR
jgi:hypothetical protein